jgi:hypothetical protein
MSSAAIKREAEYIIYLNSLINKQNNIQDNDANKVPLLRERPKHTQFISFSKEVFGKKYGFGNCSEHKDFIVMPAHSDIDYISEFHEVLFVKKLKAKFLFEKEDFLYIQPIKLKVNTQKKWSDYYMFQFRKITGAENDCLSFTEFILSGKYHDDTCILKPIGVKYNDSKKFKEENFKVEKGSPTLKEECKGYFGNTDPHNVRLALLAKQQIPDTINQSLDVDVGQAIAIVFTDWHKKVKKHQTPYHVVPVIARDGNTILTIEADASDTSRTRPVFAVYCLDPKSENTFWDTHCSMFGGDTSVAFTLSIPNDA